MASSKVITLRSSVGETYDIGDVQLFEPKTIKHLIEKGSAADNATLLPNRTAKLLLKGVEFFKKRCCFDSSAKTVGHGSNGRLNVFDADFFKVDGDTLLDLIWSFWLGDYVDTYNGFEKLAIALLQDFRNRKPMWMLEAIRTVCYEIKDIAKGADDELAAVGKTPEKLRAAGMFLAKVIGVLAGKGPQRSAALYVAGMLFSIYFKLGTIHLCQSVIRIVETTHIFDLEEIPKRDKVSYMYYTGRIEVLNENFQAACQKLSYAFTHCNPSHKANIREILIYLIPAKLSIGTSPESLLLENCYLFEYSEIVEALQRGDLQLFRRALQEHKDWYFDVGVYVVLERLELQISRRTTCVGDGDVGDDTAAALAALVKCCRTPSQAHKSQLGVVSKRDHHALFPQPPLPIISSLG